MLNRNFAIALAVAMVLAVLYGCSSNGGIKNDRDEARDMVEELQAKLDALDADGDGVADAEVTKQEELDAVQAKLDALDANEDGVADAAVTKQEELDAVQAKLDALDADGDGVADAEVTKQEELDAVQAKLDALDANEDGVADAAVTKQEELDAVQAKLDALDANEDGVADAAVTKQEELDAVQAKLDALDANEDGVADAEVTKQEELDAVQAKLDALDADGDGVADAEVTKQEELDAVQAKLDALDANKDGVADAAVTLQTRAAEGTLDHEMAIAMAIMMKEQPADIGERTADAFKREISIDDDDLTADEMASYHDIGTGWMSQAWTKTDDDMPMAGEDTTTKVVIYNNIEAPADEEFGDYYALSRDNDGVSSSEENDEMLLVLTLNNAEVGDVADRIVSTGFPSAINQTFNYSDDPDSDPATEDDNRVLTGMFHSVSGTYVCTDTPCTAMTGMDGKLMTLEGTWTFTADNAEDMVLGVTPDEDYVHFGYWLEKVTTDEDGAESFAIRGIYGGNGTPYTSSQVDVLDNIVAEYSGKATGKYMAKTVTPLNELATAASGQFVANVSLTAVFGVVLTETVEKQNTIQGDITGYEDLMNADGTELMAGWKTELGSASLVNFPQTGFTGSTTGVGGTWTGQFYGSAVDRDPDKRRW